MSGVTGTQSEVLYSWATAGTELATFTGENNLQQTMPPCQIPSLFFNVTGPRSSTLRVRAYGEIGATSTPTFLFSIRLISSTTWSAGGVLAGATAAQAASGTLVRTKWVLDADITVRTVAAAASATSTIVTNGEIRSPIFTLPVTIPSLAVSPAVATLDNSLTYYLFLSVACGTSSSLNLVNLQHLKVHGEN